MREDIAHMITEHASEVEKQFDRDDAYGSITYDVNKSLEQGNIEEVDWNKVIGDYVECAAEKALENHDGDFNHEPDEEEEI